MNKYNIRVAFQADNTLRKQLVELKDPFKSLERSNCIYRLQCQDCEACYIGQTARELGVRMEEHKRCASKRPTDATQLKKLENDSAIALHAVLSQHRVAFDNLSLLKHGFKTYKQRLISESMFILSTPDAVNRSDGHDLSPIWQAVVQHSQQQTQQHARVLN